MKRLWKVLRNNRGFLNFGGNYKSSKESATSTSKTRTEQAPSQFVQAPEFAESQGARKSWWDLLQDFSGQPGFGAISPDWSSIWENAQKKVQQYFWGSPTDPGLAGKVKASTSARNVADSPAREKLLARMGATESNVLSDMAVQQATKQAEFGEAGRGNYLQQLALLSGFNPQGTWFTPWQTQDTQGTSTGKASGWGVNANVGTDSAFGTASSIWDKLFGSKGKTSGGK